MRSRPSEIKFNTVLVRFGGEIGIKAPWTRKLYERRLISNIKQTLKQERIVYEALNRKFGRLYIKTSKPKETCQALTRVFGIASISPSIETTSTLDDIVDNSILAAGSVLGKGYTFAVRCRRVGSHTYTSQDVCRLVGQAVLEAYANRGLRVDLKHPDLTLEVEVREDQAYIFVETMKGPGGLPLGTQPKTVGLLNGDANSLIACWMVMKRGCPVIPVYFVETLEEKRNQPRVVKTAEILFRWAAGFPRKIYLASHEENIAEINKSSTEKLKSILLRRLTFRAVERLGENWRAEGIVVGDSLRKPAKKQLHLWRLLDEAEAHIPIYRPLIGLDTPEIMALAERIGISKKLAMKSKLQRTPVTSVEEISLATVENAEAKMNIDGMVESCLKSLRTVSL